MKTDTVARKSICDSCSHQLRIQGDGLDVHGCSITSNPMGDGFRALTRSVYKCSHYHQKNTMSLYQMERLAYTPDDQGHWKKPDKKAGFTMEPEL
jgi:hypothetical protein